MALGDVRLNGGSTIEYVQLPNGRIPAREFVDALDDKAAARVDAFIERLRVYGNRMEGKFVKKLIGDIFELRVKQFDRIFRVLFFYQPGMLIVIASGFQKKTQETPDSRDRPSGTATETVAEVQESLSRVAKGTRGDSKGGRDRARTKSSEVVPLCQISEATCQPRILLRQLSAEQRKSGAP